MIVIETKRLMLRNFRESDAAAFLEYMRNPIPNCFKPDKIVSIDEAQTEVTKKIGDEQWVAVCLRESDTLIGNICGFFEAPDTYSLIWNFNEKFHGLGYASEAAQAYLDDLFKKRQARRVYAYVEEYNLKSQKLCLRLGMRFEGRFAEFISFVNNEDGSPRYENTLQYALLAKEWDKR